MRSPTAPGSRTATPRARAVAAAQSSTPGEATPGHGVQDFDTATMCGVVTSVPEYKALIAARKTTWGTNTCWCPWRNCCALRLDHVFAEDVVKMSDDQAMAGEELRRVGFGAVPFCNKTRKSVCKQLLEYVLGLKHLRSAPPAFAIGHYYSCDITTVYGQPTVNVATKERSESGWRRSWRRANGAEPTCPPSRPMLNSSQGECWLDSAWQRGSEAYGERLREEEEDRQRRAKEKEAQEQRRAKAALRRARRAVQRAAQPGRRGNKKKRAKKRARQNPLSVRELAEDLNSKWSDDEDAGSPSAFGLDTDDDDEWDGLPGARREGSGLVEEGEEDDSDAEKDDFETEEARRLWAAAFHFPKGATRPLLRCKRKVNMHKRGGESCVSHVCIHINA